MDDIEEIVKIDHNSSMVEVAGEMMEAVDGFAQGSPTSAG